MELVTISSGLMPAGKPNYLDVIKYPKITDLVTQYGKEVMLKIIFLLVKDFCNSVNVVRNMNEDQMIEAAAMLLDECDNFRLEDYTMMLTMAKRGELVKIMDRIDMQVITLIMDEYWARRRKAANKLQEREIKILESIGNTSRAIESINPIDAKMIRAADGFSAAIESVREGLINNGYKPSEKSVNE